MIVLFPARLAPVGLNGTAKWAPNLPTLSRVNETPLNTILCSKHHAPHWTLKVSETLMILFLYPFYRWIKRFGEARKPEPVRKHFKAICGIPESTWAPCLDSKGMIPPSWPEDAGSNEGGIATFIITFMTSSLCADRKFSGTFPFEGGFNIDRHLLLNQQAKNKEPSPWFLVSCGLINFACTDTSFLERTMEPLPWDGQGLPWSLSFHLVSDSPPGRRPEQKACLVHLAWGSNIWEGDFECFLLIVLRPQWWNHSGIYMVFPAFVL